MSASPSVWRDGSPQVNPAELILTGRCSPVAGGRGRRRCCQSGAREPVMKELRNCGYPGAASRSSPARGRSGGSRLPAMMVRLRICRVRDAKFDVALAWPRRVRQLRQDRRSGPDAGRVVRAVWLIRVCPLAGPRSPRRQALSHSISAVRNAVTRRWRPSCARRQHRRAPSADA
jgi:hypothetical protein